MAKRNRGMLISYVLLCLLVANVAMAGFFYHSVKIPGRGKVKHINIEVYWDQGVTPVTEIDWGLLGPGDVVVKSFWVINRGNFPNVVLSSVYNNSVPANLFDYMDVTWSADGITIGKDVWHLTDLTLTVHANVTSSGITDFSFDTTLIGEG